jgi:hypothetical protein
VKHELRSVRVPPIYSKAAPDRIEMEEDDKESLLIDDREGNAAFQRFLGNVLHMALDEPTNVTLVGLSEAFKVRVISKEPVATSTYLKILQRFMWNTLSKTKTFRLIGTPVDEMIIQDRIGALYGGELFASVDYSSATDLLYSEYSDLVAHVIAETVGLDDNSAELFIRLLTKHQIEHPESGVLTPQARGQLMGSVISFPILCILNAAVCRVACEVSRNGIWIPPRRARANGNRKYMRLTLDQCPLLINGDDALMRLTPDGYKAWSSAAGIVGFSPSIGKTFFTKEFCQINSVNFNYSEAYSVGPRKCRFRRVEFINMALLYGQTRSSSKVDIVSMREGTLGARMRMLIDFAPQSTRQSLAAAFVSRNAPHLTNVKLPWFLPELVGGLGFYGVPSKEDYVYFCHAVRKFPTLPVSQRPVSLSEKSEWQTRRLAEQALKKFNCPVRVLDDEEAKKAKYAISWVGAMQMFDPLVKADSSLMHQVCSERLAVKAAIRRNERLIAKMKQEAFKGHTPLFGTDVDGQKVLLGPDMVHIVAKTIKFPVLDYAVEIRDFTQEQLFEPPVLTTVGKYSRARSHRGEERLIGQALKLDNLSRKFMARFDPSQVSQFSSTDQATFDRIYKQ